MSVTRITFGLLIWTACIATAVSTDQTHACINENMNLDCTSIPNKVVFITSAKFGQYARPDCGGSTCCGPDIMQDCQNDVDDVYPGDLDRYQKTCVNKTACTIQAATGEVKECRSPYMADYVMINYYCGAADGSDRTTTTESQTTGEPSGTNVPTVLPTSQTPNPSTTKNPPDENGPNIGAIVGGVLAAIIVVVAVILVVIFLKRRRESMHRPSVRIEKSNRNGYENKGLATDEEWQMEQKQRQLSPVIVEQDVRPRNSTTLARPRKDMPPEHSQRPKTRYSNAMRQSLGSGDAGERSSNISQNGVSPPPNTVKPTTNGIVTNGVHSSNYNTKPNVAKREEHRNDNMKGKSPKTSKFDDVDLS